MIPKIIGSKIDHFQQVDSTNNHAIDKIRQNDIEEGAVFWTDFQTLGKGQKGSFWESEHGKNLLLTVYIKPFFIKPDRQFILSQFVSVAIVEWLRKHNIQANIKWPNDILVGEYKIGGVLIENILKAHRMEHSVIGIGINVMQGQFSELLEHKILFRPISMHSITSLQYQIEPLVVSLCETLNHHYFMLKHPSHPLQDKYLGYLYQRGVWALYNIRNQSVEAKIEGVDESGKLILSTLYGEKINCDLKELVYLR